MKVWSTSDPDRALEYSFNTDATKITLHLADEKTDQLNLLLTENTAVHDDGTVVLSALDAKVIGQVAKLESHPGSHRIGFWRNPKDHVVWETRIPHGRYQVELVYSRAGSSETGASVSIDQTKLPIKLTATRSWYRYRTVRLGDLMIDQDGPSKVTVRSERKRGGVMNLKAVVLTPVAQAKADDAPKDRAATDRDS